MPSDASENPAALTSMTTVTDDNNHASSSTSMMITTGNHIQSPPLSSAIQSQTSTVIRSNSPVQVSSKQLDKLRSFLSTLYYFGLDISSEIGEHVRALILALINNALSVEEFHEKLQTTTNFPLRPFALPFLKSTLPLLQRDLLQLARQAKQSISQFVAQHEELIFVSRHTLENDLDPSKKQLNEHGKRKLSSNSHELDECSYATKRSSVNYHTHPNSMTTSVDADKERAFSSYLREYTTAFKDIGDDWKHAENMLNYILEMVTKAKRVLFMLQQKDLHLRRLIEVNDLEWRRRYAELLAQTDDHIAEVRRKAEIKRQSLVDLQKVISQTEQKSDEILLREREKYQRLIVNKFEEAYALPNRHDGPEQCWHCGRKAIETCSGCNVARYCGQYCQHRDWELHQKLCESNLKRKLNDLVPKATSLNQQKDDSKINPIDYTSTPPTLNNDHEKSESGSDQIAIVKTESS